MLKQIVGIGVILGLTLVSAGAQTLKERKAQQGEAATLASEIAYTNQICRSNILASVDWQSLSAADYDTGAGPTGSCDAVLGAIESLCADEAGKEAIREEVRRVRCVKGNSRGVELRQGTLLYKMGDGAADDFRYVRDFLIKRIAASETD